MLSSESINREMLKKLACCIELVLLWLFGFYTKANTPPDTLELSFAEADKMFLSNNLSLLSAKYGIAAQEAQILQAKLYPNPQIETEISAYNPSNGRVIDVGTPESQVAVTISQMVLLAGKRNKNVALQQALSKGSVAAFRELVNLLRQELHSNLLATYLNQQRMALFSNQIDSLKGLSEAMEAQVLRGNIALREQIRLQSLLVGLVKERADLLVETENFQQTIRVLLGVKGNIYVKVRTPKTDSISVAMLKLEALVDSALANRPDLQAFEADVSARRANLQLQKALAVPNLNLGFTYDQNSNYIRDYRGINFGIAVPIFDRNQGNIRSAESFVKQGEIEREKRELEIRNDVQNAYRRLVLSQGQRAEIKTEFSAQRDKVLVGCVTNYRKRNITLLDFLDCYDSYRASGLDLLAINQAYWQALIDLNFVTGSPITIWE